MHYLYTVNIRFNDTEKTKNKKHFVLVSLGDSTATLRRYVRLTLSEKFTRG